LPKNATFQNQIFTLALKAKSFCKGKFSPGANYFLDRIYHNVVQNNKIEKFGLPEFSIKAG
jgi:hypothetical protein